MIFRTVVKTVTGCSLVARMVRNGSFFRGLVRRFVAGDTLEEAVKITRELNARGVKVTLDQLGEHVEDLGQVRPVTEAYLKMLRTIEENRLDANVSLKLTQLGLSLDEGFTRAQLLELAETAKKHDNFVRVDMEDSPVTEKTLGIVENVFQKYGNVGTVIQSYLYRSEEDVKRLNRQEIRVRLCKGAYDEPASVAFRLKRQVDENYVSLMKLLLSEGTYPAIATHDAAMIDAAKAYAAEKKIGKERFEFQMLYGIRRDLQEELVDAGYHVRIYVPFGLEWYPYFTRRLAERPANLIFLARHWRR